ncbi:MAG: aspartyl beta-hydroxylase [Isosphaera sp.]|nr:aspartyl beta-hydroxylase [Isosphaera sp.]
MLTAVGTARPGVSAAAARRAARKVLKRAVPLGLAVYFIPVVLAVYAAFGLADYLRNRGKTFASLDRYFFGNGFFTWMLSPFNLLVDVLCLPYRNRGVYQPADLPQDHREEIAALIDAARRHDLVGQLRGKLGGTKRAMIFFKWYGKNVDASVSIPEYHRPFRYVKTVGVSVFNTRASTGRHYGPLRLTLRVLYNVNDVTGPGAYIEVGDRVHRWRDGKLFVFDDTHQHQSCNQTDEVRYCLFVDILRPSPVSRVLGAMVAAVRVGMSRVNAMFYKHWTFIK